MGQMYINIFTDIWQQIVDFFIWLIATPQYLFAGAAALLLLIFIIVLIIRHILRKRDEELNGWILPDNPQIVPISHQLPAGEKVQKKQHKAEQKEQVRQAQKDKQEQKSTGKSFAKEKRTKNEKTKKKKVKRNEAGKTAEASPPEKRLLESPIKNQLPPSSAAQIAGPDEALKQSPEGCCRAGDNVSENKEAAQAYFKNQFTAEYSKRLVSDKAKKLAAMPVGEQSPEARNSVKALANAKIPVAEQVTIVVQPAAQKESPAEPSAPVVVAAATSTPENSEHLLKLEQARLENERLKLENEKLRLEAEILQKKKSDASEIENQKKLLQEQLAREKEKFREELEKQKERESLKEREAREYRERIFREQLERDRAELERVERRTQEEIQELVRMQNEENEKLERTKQDLLRIKDNPGGTDKEERELEDREKHIKEQIDKLRKELELKNTAHSEIKNVVDRIQDSEKLKDNSASIEKAKEIARRELERTAKSARANTKITAYDEDGNPVVEKRTTIMGGKGSSVDLDKIINDDDPAAAAAKENAVVYDSEGRVVPIEVVVKAMKARQQAEREREDADVKTLPEVSPQSPGENDQTIERRRIIRDGNGKAAVAIDEQGRRYPAQKRPANIIRRSGIRTIRRPTARRPQAAAKIVLPSGRVVRVVPKVTATGQTIYVKQPSTPSRGRVVRRVVRPRDY